jgi:acetyl-CoA synthetase
MGRSSAYKETYFSAFQASIISLVTVLRDEVGYYRITGRVDDVVIVSGHNLGTAPIEDAIEHPAVAESAIVGSPHDIKGMHYVAVILKKQGISRQRKSSKSTNKFLTKSDLSPSWIKFNLYQVYLKHVQAKLCVESCVK